MTQEEKQLVLKDLYARLPYGVKIAIHGSGKLILRNVINSSIGWYVDAEGAPTDFSIDEVKPYLRPMSSITEEERDSFPTPYCFDDFSFEYDGIVSVIPSDVNSILLTFDEIFPIIDWLNSHYFDYRGLIEKGLALEAPEGMYKV